MNEIEQAREQFAAAVAAHGALVVELSDARISASIEKDPLRKLSMESALLDVSDRCESAKRVMDMHRGVLLRLEREQMQRVKRELIARYANKALEVAVLLKALTLVDERIGHPGCLALVRFALPAYPPLKSDDFGNLYSAGALPERRAEAVTLLDMLLVECEAQSEKAAA